MESRDWSSDVCSSDLFPSHDMLQHLCYLTKHSFIRLRHQHFRNDLKYSFVHLWLIYFCNLSLRHQYLCYLTKHSSTYATQASLLSYPTFTYGSSTYVGFGYASNTFTTILSTPSYTYASSTFLNYSYGSSTFPSFSYATNTFATLLNTPSYAYATNTFATILNTPSIVTGKQIGRAHV